MKSAAAFADIFTLRGSLAESAPLPTSDQGKDASYPALFLCFFVSLFLCFFVSLFLSLFLSFILSFFLSFFFYLTTNEFSSIYLPGEGALGLLPFYHIYGIIDLIFHLSQHRARVVTLPAFDPKSFLSAIQTHQMAVLHLVPPLVVHLGTNGFD